MFTAVKIRSILHRCVIAMRRLEKALAPATEPRCEKTGLQGFRPGPTQTGLCSHRRWLEAWNFGFRK